MTRFVKTIISFGLCMLLLLAAYGLFCDFFFKKRKYFPSDNKRMWVLKQTKLSMDYAVLGSSRANGAFDMRRLDSLTMLKGINIAADGSGYVDNYLILYKFLQNNNKIKFLFFQTDNYSFDPERNFSSAFHIYNFLPFWNEPEFEKAITHYLDNTDRMMFTHLPSMRFYKYNRYFSPIQVLSRLRKKKIDPALMPDNHFSSPNSENPPPKNIYGIARSKSFKINSIDQEYLLRIIELCKRNRIQVICFRAPDFYFQEQVFTNYRSTNEYLRNLLTQKEVLYLEPDEKIRKDRSCFEDAGHLNNYGRFIYTSMFSKQIKEKLINVSSQYFVSGAIKL